jgi:hypothetical protein
VRGTPVLLPIASSNGGAIYSADCADGVERFCKTNGRNPWACCNEWVAAQVAAQAGFAVLPVIIVDSGSQLWFGTEYLPPVRRAVNPAGPGGPDFLRCRNAADVVAQAIALDAFLVNPDRHHENILLAADKATTSAVWTAYLHDHDRALFGAPVTAPAGVARLRHFTANWHDGWALHQTAWVRYDQAWAASITDWSRIQNAMQQLLDIPLPVLRTIVEQIPDDWIAGTDRWDLLRFLLRRRLKLIAVVDGRRAGGAFPNA